MRNIVGAREQSGSIETMTREKAGAARADSLELRAQAHKKGHTLARPLTIVIGSDLVVAAVSELYLGLATSTPGLDRTFRHWSLHYPAALL